MIMHQYLMKCNLNVIFLFKEVFPENMGLDKKNVYLYL